MMNNAAEQLVAQDWQSHIHHAMDAHFLVAQHQCYSRSVFSEPENHTPTTNLTGGTNDE